MARSELVKQMLMSYQRGDDGEFRRVADEVIADERRKRHDVLADELERIVSGPRKGRRPLHISTLKPLPTTRTESPLLDLEQPVARFTDLVLRPHTADVLGKIVSEFQQREVLAAHGLEPPNRLMFVGPPGTGKSKSAHAVAAALGLPLARLQLSAVVSSYLGETAHHLKQVLDFCESGTWVLLIDEIDMLAKERGDQTEHGELRRVVAAFLQLLDDFSGETMIIATSNHAELLDPAVWRRFDEVVAFESPTQAEIAELLALNLRRFQVRFNRTEMARKLKGRSHADVEIISRTAARRSILDGRTEVREADMQDALERLRSRTREVDRFLS